MTIASRPMRQAAALVWMMAPAGGASAQETTRATIAAGDTASASTTDNPQWIATLSGGLLDRGGDQAQPYVAAGLSRKLGRGYVRAAITSYRGIAGETDAERPASFVLGSIGTGATFGRWFVDGYVAAGHQHYGDFNTPLGSQPSPIAGSTTWGGGLDAGRYTAISRRLFLTPSISLQYNADKVLDPISGADLSLEQEKSQRVVTGIATVRLDRYFGKDDRHLIGLSVGRVQTSNGSSVLVGSAAAGGEPGTFDIRSVADGWFLGGASASIRLAHRLWIDTAATRTFGARSGKYAIATVGLRKAF